MAAGLAGAGGPHARVPPPHQLLDRGDVDRPVVQEVLDLGEVGSQEAAVGPDGVAAEWHGPRLGDVLPDEGQGGGAGLLERHGRGLDGLQQPRAGVHVDHERVHGGQDVVGLVDDEVGALDQDVQLVVGDQGGDLDDDVTTGIQSRHLEIHPDEHDGSGLRAGRPPAGSEKL